MDEMVNYTQKQPYDNDLDKDTAVMIAQFMLDPDIPKDEFIHFQDFYVMFSKIAPLSNIEREDIYKHKVLFKLIAMLLNEGHIRYAHELMAEYLMELQLSRGIDALWTMYGQRGVQSVEYVERMMKKQRKHGFMDKVKATFGRREKEGQGADLGE